MSRRIVLAATMVAIPLAVLSARPTVNLTVPPPDRYGIEDLWKATVNSDTVCDAWFEGFVFDAAHGQVFHATSGPFALTRGTEFYGYGDVTIEETDTRPGYEAFVTRSGHPPSGSYRFELILQPFNVEASYEFNVKPTGPPRLVAPAEGATITEPHPLFVWTRPVPPPSGPVSYDLKIVEVPPELTRQEAMRTVVPWFEERGLVPSSHKYPPSARALEPGKSYGWSVTAHAPGFLPEQGLESEVNGFTVRGPLSPPSVNAVSPSTAGQGQSVEIAISGEDFAEGARVSFALGHSWSKEDLDDDCHHWKCPTCGNTWTCYASFCVSCYNAGRGKVKGQEVCEKRQCPACGKAYQCSYARCGDCRKTLERLEGLGVATTSVVFVSSAALRAAVDVDPNAPFVTRDVVVTNPGGQAGMLVDGFVVSPPAKPCGGTGVPCQKWQCQKCKQTWECSSSKCPGCNGTGKPCQKWQCQKCRQIWECSSNKCPDPKCGGSGRECQKWQCQKCRQIWECSSNKCPDPKCGGSGQECQKWQCQKCKQVWECSSSKCPGCKGAGSPCQKWQCQKCKKIWECSSDQCPSEP